MRSLGDSVYQLLPPTSEFFLMRVRTKSVRQILVSPEQPVNLKGVNIIWKVLTCLSVFVILILIILFPDIAFTAVVQND